MRVHQIGFALSLLCGTLSVAAQPADAGPKAPFTLTMNVIGNGVTDPPAGVHVYDEGQVITFRATPDPDWAFDHWEGGLTGTYPVVATYLNSDTTVTAVFSEGGPTLSIAVVGGGTTDPPPGTYHYVEGRTASISAVPDSGWSFDHWEGDLSGTVPMGEVLMDGDKTVTAVFSETPTHTLTIIVVGDGTTDPLAGTHDFVEGAFVLLQAFPDPGWAFDHWEGDLTGTESIRSIEMDSDKTVTAVFVEGDYTLTIAVVGEGFTIPAAGTHYYADGAVASLSASPATGWRFDHWEGDLTGTEPYGEVLMDSDKSVTGVFV
ncbi:MAG TPA: hypothetical protein PKL84_04750, partial [Candidatus Hydrogenedentes bacterium]|nr:hypothetical protein [Candidatus Hydrogenedentota bacterium]